MNFRFALICTALMSTSFCKVTPAAPIANPALGLFPSSINVKDYGAKGDGKTDDTQSIQAAIIASEQQYAKEKWSVQARHWDNIIKGAAKRAHSEVVFPSGTYKISSTIVVSGFQYLRGIGDAVIEQSDATKDSFYLQNALFNTVENIHFKGGKNQLRIWTRNLGEARVSIEDCTFTNSKDFAIECSSYIKQIIEGENWRNSEPWAPYEVKMIDGIAQLTPSNSDHIKPWFHSTLFNVTRCSFANVMGAINTNADVAVIKDAKVTTSLQMEGAAFRLAGYMSQLNGVQGLAQLAPSKHQYWIESADRSQLSVRNCDLNTNSAQGICLLRSYATPSLSSVILENNRVKSAGCREGGLVWIAKGTQPNIVSIVGTQEISGKPVKAITWEHIPLASELETLKEEQRYSTSETLLEYIYKIHLSKNSSNVDHNLPQVFASLAVKPVSLDNLKDTFIPELSWEYSTLENQARMTKKVLLATDFGLDQSLSTDDTAAIKKVFDAAAKQGLCLVIFPAGIFTLTDTIQLPANVVVRATGVASFVQSDSAKDLFQAKSAETIAFKNCNFHGGLNGVNITSNANQKSRIAFDYFSFYDQQENGIKVFAGKGQTGEKNLTEIRVHSGSFAGMHAVTTNAARSQLESFWALNNPKLNDAAYIRNLGGAMRVQSMVSNPVLWHDKGKRPTEITDWQGSKNTRWIDNWGQLYCLDNRFGGESGGMCNIFNHTKTGTVFVGGGTASFNSEYTRKCILFMEAKPRLAVLSDITTLPVYQSNASRYSVMNADGTNGRSTPGVIVAGVPTP